MKDEEKNKIKNLNNTDAIKKLQELADSASVCMFETQSTEPPNHLRPMSPVKTDDQGSLWFFSSKSSQKNKEVADRPFVQLSFSNLKNSEFLSVYGKAEIILDKAKFKELWIPIVKVWFPEGAEDPDLSLIKVSPENCYYWDTKHSKMVALLKMAVSIATGKTLDDGVEGKLKI